ncbi:MAG: hypothetical protein R3B69_03740 [Candidatus Paceibacterota bacterium]
MVTFYCIDTGNTVGTSLPVVAGISGSNDNAGWSWRTINLLKVVPQGSGGGPLLVRVTMVVALPLAVILQPVAIPVLADPVAGGDPAGTNTGGFDQSGNISAGGGFNADGSISDPPLEKKQCLPLK